MTNRSSVRPPQWVYWVRRSVALLVLVVVIMGVVRVCSGPEKEPAPDRVPESAPVSTVGQSENGGVAQGRPVEMVIPQIGLRAEFEDVDCRVKGEAINPATLSRACVYTAPDRPYELPGTDAGDITVIAGHTGAGVSGVFDKLYDTPRAAHSVAAGDQLYLRTAKSGEMWLRYVATDLHDPVKEGLAEDAAVWGTGPTPGRLLTISCIQPANLLANSVRNAVVGWQFDGTATDVEVEGK